MNTEETQKPAFPCDWIDRDSMGVQVIREQHYGITIRDYFAAKALSGLIATAFTAASQTRTDPDVAGDSLVRACYKIADRMIKEGSKP